MSNGYSINIKEDAELAKLIKGLASKNRAEFEAASEAMAAFIGDTVLQVVEAAPVISNLFTTVAYNEGSAPSLPLDVYYDIRDKNYLQVWTQSMPGGLATNFVHGLNELMVSTYELDSGISMLKKYARDARLDVLSATMERMAQEILIKQETVSAGVTSAVLGSATYSPVSGGAARLQGIRANTAGTFQLHDFNRLITLLQRIRPSWVGGTPTGGNVVSHLVASPEIHEDLRAIAYQPQNTRAGSIGGSETSNTSLAAPDSIREGIFNAAGNVSFFGVELLNVFDLGVGQAYNTLFANYAGAAAIDGGAQFNAATEECLWALSLRSNPRALTRLVERSADNGGVLTTQPDDSFPMRSEKLGFFSKLREGRVILDSRNLAFAAV